MLGLVRGLVEWVPTSAEWAGYVAGPVVVLGYLVGSVPVGDLVATRRFRRQLAAPDLRGIGVASSVDPTAVVTEVLAALLTLLVATVAWDVGHEAAPPGSFSAIGTYANQALGAWASIGLWTGTAAMLGSMAPVWTRFRRGRSGIGPALALLLAYTPVLAVAGVTAGSIGYGLSQRRRASLAVAVAAIVVTEYVAWITDTQAGWGITNGPEVGLWSAVVAVALVARSVQDG
jgi:glycerol-3-phosphate acyltransferase PlsY